MLEIAWIRRKSHSYVSLCSKFSNIYFNAITYLKYAEEKIRQCLTLIYLLDRFACMAQAVAPTAAAPINKNATIVVNAA